MIKSKSLGESGWKEILSKNKGLKDNGLQKALAELGKSLEAEDFDASLKGLDVALKLAGQLKKSKEVSAVAAAAKHMGEVIDAAETAIKEVNKAKAEAEKKAKADAAAQAKKKEKDDENDAGDEEEESSDLLTTKLIPLLRTVKGKGEKMHALIATTGKQVVVLLSRKPISPARRKLLKDELGGAGGIKYIPGHCIREHGKVTFVLEKQVSGMRKLIEAALYEQTKQRTKVKCRTQDGEYDDEDTEEDTEDEDDSSGDDAEQEGDEEQGDDTGQARKADAETDHEEDSGKAAAGAAQPAATVAVKTAPQELARAPLLWDSTRKLMQKNIESLKAAVQTQLADEGADFIAQINDQMKQLDRILGRLDERLSESLTNAANAQDAGERRAELGIAKAILADYIRYVGSEPLIAHLDGNPFGVKTDLKVMLTASLTKLARTIS